MEIITTKKIGDNTLQVTRTATEVSEATYTLDYLLKQKASIQQSKDDFDALRNKELTEIDTLIAECEKLGIVVKEIEEVPIKEMPIEEISK